MGDLLNLCKETALLHPNGRRPISFKIKGNTQQQQQQNGSDDKLVCLEDWIII